MRCVTNFCFLSDLDHLQQNLKKKWVHCYLCISYGPHLPIPDLCFIFRLSQSSVLSWFRLKSSVVPIQWTRATDHTLSLTDGGFAPDLCLPTPAPIPLRPFSFCVCVPRCVDTHVRSPLLIPSAETPLPSALKSELLLWRIRGCSCLVLRSKAESQMVL